MLRPLAIILFSAIFFFTSCAPKVVETGKASYYSDKFKGKKTASGKKYRKSKRTAAHKSIPLGTKVKVTNLRNGRVVKVEINDRGPFVRGRIIDLSKKAARKLDMLNEGVGNVRLEYRAQR